MEAAKRPTSIFGVIKSIENLPAMSCIDAKDYAVENGWAHVVAEKIQNSMKINQLRKFFNSVKRIKEDLRAERDDREIDAIDSVSETKYELFPELAYAYGRRLITEDFYELMTMCLRDRTSNVGDFRAFEKFLSAILAYCKMCERSSGSD